MAMCLSAASLPAAVTNSAVKAGSNFIATAAELKARIPGQLRVTKEEEQTGLDISEHGMHAYPADRG